MVPSWTVFALVPVAAKSVTLLPRVLDVNLICVLLATALVLKPVRVPVKVSSLPFVNELPANLLANAEARFAAVAPLADAVTVIPANVNV